MKPETAEAFRRLESWSQTLVNHVASELPIVRELAEGKRSFGPAPSKGAAAEMQLRRIKQDVDEIVAALRDLESGLHRE